MIIYDWLPIIKVEQNVTYNECAKGEDDSGPDW